MNIGYLSFSLGLSIFEQSFTVYKFCTSFVHFLSKYFVLFEAIVIFVIFLNFTFVLFIATI